MNADGTPNGLSHTATQPKVARKETIAVLSRGIPQGECLSAILRNAGYGVALKSEVLTGLELSLADTRVVVFVNSWPYWRIDKICEICSALRLAAPTLPLVVVGPNDVEAKVRLFSLGVDDYVVEPYEHKEFLARIKSIIRRRSCGTF
jgi:DNA-binding response OmpR family regulator